MKTSEIIKEILNINELSQDKLAKILKVSQKAISNWLNEADTPKASSMMLIYDNFGITPNELLGLEEPKNFKCISLEKKSIYQKKCNNELFIYNDGTHFIKHKKN